MAEGRSVSETGHIVKDIFLPSLAELPAPLEISPIQTVYVPGGFLLYFGRRHDRSRNYVVLLIRSKSV